jgi:phosphoribosyl 1,2-cyclic phosphodiesterase
MSVSVTVLASGSRGNSAVIASSATRILVDAGISGRETFKRLRAAGENPHSLSAILITHEHCDHVAGLERLARKLCVPVFMTGPTHSAWRRALRDEEGNCPKLEKLEVFSAGKTFIIGDIDITPFTIPHDAIDPVGFTFRSEGVKIGYATDLGYVPASICDHLRNCDVLVIESNHDEQMLRNGPYPWHLKRRVSGDRGHLSNSACGRLLSQVLPERGREVWLAHLSKTNNIAQIADSTVRAELHAHGYRQGAHAIHVLPPQGAARRWEPQARQLTLQLAAARDESPALPSLH